jgi:hypothetical protein
MKIEMSDNLTPWQRYKKNLGDTRVWDMFDPSVPTVTNEVAQDRYSICIQCPELINLTKQCKKCGCFMVAKTKLEKATCPLGKW